MPIVEKPFASDLFHSNFIRASTDDSNGKTTTYESLTLIQGMAPELKITTGVTGSDNPNVNFAPTTNPPSADATEVEAGDRLDFTTTVENVGGAPGFDLRILDELPAELGSCQLAATDPVKNKSGAAVPFTGGFTGNALEVTFTNPNDNFDFKGSANDLFTVDYSCVVDAATGPGISFETLASTDWSVVRGDQRFPPDSAQVMITMAGSIALPVELLNLQASAQEKTIELSWQTATEDNNEGFTVQRSLDGTSFAEVGFVAGMGASNETVNYRFEDTEVRQGAEYFYRLQQLDFDGTKTNSNIVSARLEASYAIAVFPNPASAELFISRSSREQGELYYELFSTLGQRIVEGKTADVTARIDLSQIPVGSYFVRVSIDGQSTETKRVVIRK